jgi:CheY-like chemotaxis protein
MVELRVDSRDWPVRAQLHCAFAHQALDEPATSAEVIEGRINTMHWHLLEQTARTLGLVFDRQVDATHARLRLEFPNTVLTTLQDDAADDFGHHGFADSVNSKPLAGSHVLVIASRRDLRLQVREALKGMGLVIDFVSSVREAVAFCREGLPHAIVFEGMQRSRQFEQLADGIRQEVPEFVFVELVDEGRTFDISTISATGMARVGCEGIANALPSALVYELSRVM